MKFSIVDALHDTEKSFYIKNEDYKTLQWNDNSTKPTLKELETKRDQLQAEYDAKQYQSDRSTSYPSIQEQLDMQYWDAVNGTKKWQEAVAKVKTDNPKPE